MNISDISDFDLNKKVARSLPPILSDNQSASLKAHSSSVLLNDIVSEWEFNPIEIEKDLVFLIKNLWISVAPPLCLGDRGLWTAKSNNGYIARSKRMERAVTECAALFLETTPFIKGGMTD